MGLPLNTFAPELRDLEKSTLNQLHAAIHQKDMRNSDRLLIFSTSLTGISRSGRKSS
jgi:hypothetical protein